MASKLGTFSKKSIETLSNILFGLALSIGALTLGTSFHGNTQTILNIIAFGFNFVILIFIWIRYNRILSLLTEETNFELALNIMVLFLVVILPYLFNLLLITSNAAADFTSTLYGLDIGGMLLSLGGIYSLAVRRHARVTMRRF